MYARKVTKETLTAAAAAVGVDLDMDPKNQAGTSWRVKVNLRVPPEAYTPSGRRKTGKNEVKVRYQRLSASSFSPNRRVNAVCWHGFRDFFRAVYAIEPEAIFRTAIAKYEGSDAFECTFPLTAHKNIGSRFRPVAADEACECWEDGE